MNENKKAMKVTVLPAGHPLLRNISSDQQVVMRPQQIQQQNNPQQLFIRPQSANNSVNQQIIFRPQQAATQSQSLVIRPQSSQQSNQPLIIRPNQLSEGQIRLTPQQLASLTNNQQIIIRPPNSNARPQVSTQQIIIRNQHLQASTTGPSLHQASVTSKTYSSISGKSQPVVTYLRQNPNNLNLTRNPENTQHSGSVIQNIKLSGNSLSNVRFSVANNLTTSNANNLILDPSNLTNSNVIRLGARNISNIRLPTSSISSGISLPYTSKITLASSAGVNLQSSSNAVHNTGISLQNSSTYAPSTLNSSGLTVHRQKPNVIRSVPTAKQIAPKNVTNFNIPKSNHVVLNPIQIPQETAPSPSNNIMYSPKSSPQQVSLLTPNRNIQPKTTIANSQKVEGLQLITADGKFINTEGLHLLSPNGTVLKAENLFQNLSFKPKLNAEQSLQPDLKTNNNKIANISATEISAQQLISNIQQPIPYQPNLSSSASKKPPPKIISNMPNILSPPMSPQVIVPRTSNSESKDLLSSSVNPPRIIPTNAPPMLPSSPTQFQNAQNIQNMLPTQPLLPSQIKGLTPVARSLNFSPKQPPKPKAKSKKETLRAKIQKLESNLNAQPLLSLIDKKYTNNNRLVCDESEIEREYLTSLEHESRGENLTRQTVNLQDNYYKLNKVCRYIDLNSTSDSDENLNDHIDESYLLNMMKKHMKRKKRKTNLLNSEELENTSLNIKKIIKGRGRGRPNKTEKGTTVDNHNFRRHRLWVSIMKKEVPKGGKARNYNSKEKMANAKRLATSCMRAQRQRAMASQRAMKEAVWRAKRLTREMQSHWRKYEREEKQQKKAKEKVALEQRKMDIEILEAKRQQRKLNFLITQTELYAHFMAGKLGHQSEDTETTILSKLDSDIKEERLRELDDYDENAMKEKVKQTATYAAKKQEAIRTNFDQKCGLEKGTLRMSEAAENAGDRPQPEMFQGKLKTYQLKGMNWLCSLYDQGINGILADEMGLGKTVQALAFLAHTAESYGVWGPFLVVTPASTLHNWQQEIARFVPDFKCVPYWGSPQERKVLRGFWTQENLHTKKASFHIVVTSYQIVITDYKYFNRHAWQHMVLDEAQAIKSANSQRWKMLLDFKCRGRLLLSGTPIQNTMAELWSLLHFVMPSLFDSHDEFKEWFSKDIEGHAEGTKGKVDEKQMGRLHLILKPFMLRRIKKDVENELTDKIEVLVYCPLTIRQRLLYAGLKQNIHMEELLAGLGLGSGATGMGVSSLMNLVMQFRKVCNHPELFERREAKSALLFNLPVQVFPKMPFLEKPKNYSTNAMFNIFRSDSVQESLQTTRKCTRNEYLEVSESPFGFLRFINLTPGELESQNYSIFHRLVYTSHLADQHQMNMFKWTKAKEKQANLILQPLFLPADFTFASKTSNFLSHKDIRIMSCPETISHRLIRSRQIQNNKDGVVNLVAEFSHSERDDEIRKCIPTICPTFLQHLTNRVGSLPKQPHFASRTLEYYNQDHLSVKVNPSLSAQNILLHGSVKLHNNSFCSSHYSEPATGGLTSSRPTLGWSGIVIPEKQSLISDAGKLFVLDGLLARLKEGGHRVLIYSQMTRMIDLLEEYMSHRQHSYMRLDGSSKIHERRDMVADFQNRQDIFIFLLSTRAGGLGINLTAADTVIFYDSDWNPTVDQQAMDRAHRLGQTRQVTVYRLICKGTIEERILQRAREKSEIHRMVIQGGSFKGKGGDLKPKEVVSLLLDDDELEKRVRIKVEEEEEKVEKEKGEKGEKTKGKKREGGVIKKESLKKPKIEIKEEENIDIMDDPQPLYDFAGDKMGPKKPKGRGGGKRGRPRGTVRGVGRGESSRKIKQENNYNLDMSSNDATDEVFGFYNQTC